MSKYNSNVSNNPYKRGNRENVDNQRDYFTAEKKTPTFSEFFLVPTEVKEAIDLTDGGSIKSVISQMSNMGMKSESTGSNYKKAQKMWNNCSDDTGAFPKLNKMEKNDIEGASGKQLATSLIVFSIWMLSEPKPGLDGQKHLVGVYKSCRRLLE